MSADYKTEHGALFYNVDGNNQKSRYRLMHDRMGGFFIIDMKEEDVALSYIEENPMLDIEEIMNEHDDYISNAQARITELEAELQACKADNAEKARLLNQLIDDGTELEAENESLHTQLRETLQLLSQYREAYERAMLDGSDETTAPDASDQDTQELPAVGDYDDNV